MISVTLTVFFQNIAFSADIFSIENRRSGFNGTVNKSCFGPLDSSLQGSNDVKCLKSLHINAITCTDLWRFSTLLNSSPIPYDVKVNSGYAPLESLPGIFIIFNPIEIFHKFAKLRNSAIMEENIRFWRGDSLCNSNVFFHNGGKLRNLANVKNLYTSLKQ